MYFESHAHYDDKRFREDREELLSTLLPASGVDTVINIGCDVKSSEMSIRLAENIRMCMLPSVYTRMKWAK